MPYAVCCALFYVLSVLFPREKALSFAFGVLAGITIGILAVGSSVLERYGIALRMLFMRRPRKQ